MHRSCCAEGREMLSEVAHVESTPELNFRLAYLFQQPSLAEAFLAVCIKGFVTI